MILFDTSVLFNNNVTNFTFMCIESSHISKRYWVNDGTCEAIVILLDRPCL